MKKVFYRGGLSLFGITASLLALEIVVMVPLTVYFAIIGNQLYVRYMLIVIGIIFAMPLIIIIAAPHLTLYKIYLSEIGIELKLFKKQIKFMEWKDVANVYTKKWSPRSKGTRIYISTSNDELYIERRKQLLNSMVGICPILDVKQMLIGITNQNRSQK